MLPRIGSAHNLQIAAVTSPLNASYGGISQIGDTILTTGAVKFTSSNPGVAQIYQLKPGSDGFQNCRMYKPGTATITARATDGGNAKATMKLIIKGIPVERIILESEFRLSPGITRRSIPVFDPVVAWDKSVVWTSSNKSVATVDQDGNITAHKRGDARITCRLKSGGASDSVDLSISCALNAESAYHIIALYGNENSVFTENVALMKTAYEHNGDLSDYYDLHIQNWSPRKEHVVPFLVGSTSEAADVEAKDVTIVYFTGFADTNPASDTFGALMLANGVITVEELQAILEAIPGTVVLVLDCPMSGQFISDKGASASARTRAKPRRTARFAIGGFARCPGAARRTSRPNR